MTAACSGDTILKSGCTMCRTEVSVVFAEQVVNLLTVKVSNVINPSNHLVRVHLLYYFMVNVTGVCYCLLQTLLPAGEDTFTVSEVIVQATK